MTDRRLGIYASLSRWPRPKSYEGKILLVAFLGTHVPLLTLLGFFVASTAESREQAIRVLVVALVATLAGTGATLYALHRLLAPIALTYQAFRAYLSQRQVPDLPTTFTDEAGILMADAQHAIGRLDETIRHLASYDQVTGLPNRASFRDGVRHAMAQSRRDGHPFAVLVLELDGFQTVNAALGLGAGDALLAAAAQRLTTGARESDLLARLEGAEFALLSAGEVTVDGAAAMAQRMLDLLARPIAVGGRTLHVSASVGVTVFPADEGGVDELLGNASAAVREAREAGGGQLRFYAAELNARLQQRMAVEADLRDAIARGEFRLEYQPKVELTTGDVTGAEALLRWEHPTRGRVAPGEFISVAEQTGLIVPIGAWVVRAACAQVAAWRAAGHRAPRVSVNLSARQFADEALVETILGALADAGLEPSALGVEVTESLLLTDTGRVAASLARLRAAGVIVSLDDFGTGYSSLSYLKRLPIDVLKVDQSFVRELETDAGSRSIVRAVVALAHSLGMRALAEGVETPEQAALLRACGCDMAQGYYFGRPAPADRPPASRVVLAD